MDLRQRFEGRILAITDEVATIWGKLQGKAEKKGEKVPVVNSLIAASAIAHNLVVVTRNVSDMEKSGVEVFNPWK